MPIDETLARHPDVMRNHRDLIDMKMRRRDPAWGASQLPGHADSLPATVDDEVDSE